MGRPQVRRKQCRRHDQARATRRLDISDLNEGELDAFEKVLKATVLQLDAPKSEEGEDEAA
jgi:hypothetical protein